MAHRPEWARHESWQFHADRARALDALASRQRECARAHRTAELAGRAVITPPTAKARSDKRAAQRERAADLARGPMPQQQGYQDQGRKR
eukprot:16441061-Heterocapsa_arctica.AAC.1